MAGFNSLIREEDNFSFVVLLVFPSYSSRIGLRHSDTSLGTSKGEEN